MKEQRSFTRVPFETDVLISIGGERHRGRTQNLSLYGVYICLDYKLDVETEVEVTIPLPYLSETYIGVTGKVARCAADGVGIRFQQLDVDTFIELKNIVSTTSGDEGKIMDEFFRYITHDQHAATC